MPIRNHALPLSRLILSAMLLFAFAAYANIYKQIDKNGKTVYSDIPIAQSAKIHKPEFNMPPPKPAAQSTTDETTSPYKYQSLYKKVIIERPSAGEIISNPNGNVEIKVKVLPSLRTLHKIQLIIDNIDQGANRSSRFRIQEASPGKHIIKAQVIDQKGQVIISSDEIAFEIKPSTKP